MAWAIRRSVFSSHAIWPDYLNTQRLMAWKHAIWRKLLYSTLTRPGEGAINRYLSRQGKIAGDSGPGISTRRSRVDYLLIDPRGL